MIVTFVRKVLNFKCNFEETYQILLGALSKGGLGLILAGEYYTVMTEHSLKIV